MDHDEWVLERESDGVYLEEHAYRAYLVSLGCLLIMLNANLTCRYSVDYPFAKNEEGLRFMQELEKSGLVTKEQFEMIGFRNSEKLLGLSVTAVEKKSDI